MSRKSKKIPIEIIENIEVPIEPEEEIVEVPEISIEIEVPIQEKIDDEIKNPVVDITKTLQVKKKISEKKESHLKIIVKLDWSLRNSKKFYNGNSTNWQN